MESNIMLMTDSYKVSQSVQYPPNTTKIYSYFAARGVDKSWPWQLDPEMMYFGLQYLIKRYLEGVQVTPEKLEEAKEMWASHFGDDRVFREDRWRYILDEHGGKLPISIKALPEGTVLPVGVVPMTIENTDPECFWLTNWLETMLSWQWYSCSVATRSYMLKQELKYAMFRDGSDVEGLPFKLHDFGYRGVSSEEQAAIGGAAHLINFMGTDTFAGVRLLREYYGATMAGFSIPATEHSTVTSWGRDHESDAFRNFLKANPTGIIACVSDSYDIFAACRDLWGDALKDEIEKRDGTLVVRPDSGDPLEVLPRVLEILGDKFGFTTNERGFKVLNPKVRVIQGDGIDPSSLKDILDMLCTYRWAVDNIAFGSGGGLLEKDLTRDSLKFAIKCSYTERDGKGFPVYKDPVTDKGKSSRQGRLCTIRKHEGSPLETVSSLEAAADGHICLLEEVFRDGDLLKETSLDDIRSRSAT